MILNVLLTRQEETHLDCSCVQLHLTSASYRSLSTTKTHITQQIKERSTTLIIIKKHHGKNRSFLFIKRRRERKRYQFPVRSEKWEPVLTYTSICTCSSIINLSLKPHAMRVKKQTSIITSLLSLTRKCNNESYSRTLV